jgi:hypothetical protein
MIVTDFSWPSRKIRPIAWFSTEGLNCGSIMWTMLAALSLFKLQNYQLPTL